MGILKNLYDLRDKAEIQRETDEAVQKFLASGGSVTTVKGKRVPAKLTANGKTSGQVFTNLYN
jgi:hypothetical protein